MVLKQLLQVFIELNKNSSLSGGFFEMFSLREGGSNVYSDSLGEGFTWKDLLIGRKKL